PRAGGISQTRRRRHGDASVATRRQPGELREGKMAKTHITMKVNGAEVEGLVEPRTLLVHFIRENLGLTGTHIGCETTHCGPCTGYQNIVKAIQYASAKINGVEFQEAAE